MVVRRIGGLEDRSPRGGGGAAAARGGGSGACERCDARCVRAWALRAGR
eukprot:COSAG01_NODE_25001_length_758_cov_45.714719_2_plen_48_part_01